MESQWVPLGAARSAVGFGSDSQFREIRNRVSAICLASVNAERKESDPDSPPIEISPLERDAHPGVDWRTEIDLPNWLLWYTRLLRQGAAKKPLNQAAWGVLFDDEDDGNRDYQKECFKQRSIELTRKNMIAEKLLLPVAEVQTVLVVAAGGLRMIADDFCEPCRERYMDGLARVDQQIEALLADGGDTGEAEAGDEADDGAPGAAGGGESGAGSGAGGAAAAGAEPA